MEGRGENSTIKEDGEARFLHGTVLPVEILMKGQTVKMSRKRNQVDEHGFGEGRR